MVPVNLKINLISIAIILFSLTNSEVQNLKPKAVFGIRALQVTDSISKVYSLTEIRGILVNKIIPNSTAVNLKIKEKDILLKIKRDEY